MSSYLRLKMVGCVSGMPLLVRSLRWSKRAACAVLGRSSPATVAKVSYLLAFAVVVSLLLAPGRSRGQFRGLPAPLHNIPPTMPFSPIFPSFTPGFTGLSAATFSIPTFNPLPTVFPSFSFPGPMANFPLSNFGTDSSGLFPFIGGFSGFSAGISSFASPFGLGRFGTFGFSNGLGFAGGGIGGMGFAGGGGLTGFGGFSGFGGFNRVGFGFNGGLGGFAGKGFGGFNGSNGL